VQNDLAFFLLKIIKIWFDTICILCLGWNINSSFASIIMLLALKYIGALITDHCRLYQALEKEMCVWEREQKKLNSFLTVSSILGILVEGTLQILICFFFWSLNLL